MDDYRRFAPASQIYRHCPLCAASLHDERDPVNARVRPTCVACGWIYTPVNPQGALTVVEVDAGIVLVLPPGAPAAAPASLPSGLVEYGETPEAAALRLTFEQTGLQVEIVRELVRFLQEGTPFGPVLDFGFVARPIGGALRSDGPEGPAGIYPLHALPAIIPIRAANQRVLGAYLISR